jgi:hypothetical protein
MGLVKGVVSLAPVRVAYVQTAAAGTAPSGALFTNPAGSGEYFEVVAVNGYWDVVGGAAAAADVKIGTAPISAGTTALASAFDLTAGARAATAKALTATAANRIVPPGSTIAVVTSGTLTGLTGLVVQVVLRPIRGREPILA